MCTTIRVHTRDSMISVDVTRVSTDLRSFPSNDRYRHAQHETLVWLKNLPGFTFPFFSRLGFCRNRPSRTTRINSIRILLLSVRIMMMYVISIAYFFTVPFSLFGLFTHFIPSLLPTGTPAILLIPSLLRLLKN